MITSAKTNTSPMTVRAHSASNARPPERDWQESFYALESRYRQTQKLLNERDGEVKMLKVALRRGYPLQNTTWAPMHHSNKNKTKNNTVSKVKNANRQGQTIRATDNNLPKFISEFDESLSSTLSSESELELTEEESSTIEEQLNREHNQEWHKNKRPLNKAHRSNDERKRLQVHNNRDVLRYISPNTAHIAINTRKKEQQKQDDNIDEHVNDNVKAKSYTLQTNEEGNVKNNYNHVESKEKPAESDVWATVTDELASNLPDPQLIWGSETNVKAYIAASALHHANEELRRHLRELSRAKEEVEKNCAQYKREVQTLQTKLHDRTLELHQVVGERDVAVQKWTASTQQITSYEENLQSHLRQTDTMRFEYDTQITELRSKLIAGADSNEILTRDVRGLIQESREKTNELMALRSQLSLTESSLLSQRNMNENLLVEMKSLNSQLMEERKRLLAASRDARQCAIAHDQLVAAQEEIRTLQDERTIMEQAHGKLLGEMVQLTERATKVAEEQSQCKLDEAHCQAAHWEHVSQLLYKDIAQREAEYKNCREESAKWEKQCTEYETHVQSLRSALSAYEAKLNVVWPRHMHDTQFLTLEQIKLLGQNKRAHVNAMHTKAHHHSNVKSESATAENNNERKTEEKEGDKDHTAENTEEKDNHINNKEDDDSNDNNIDIDDMESILPHDFTSEAEQIEELLEANASLEAEVNQLQLNNSMLQDRIKELTRQRDNEQRAMHKAAIGVVQSEQAKERLLIEQIDRVAFLEAQVRNLRGNRVEPVNSTHNVNREQNAEQNVDEGDDEKNVLELFLGQIVSATGEPYTQHDESMNQTNNNDYTFAHIFCSIDFLLHDTVTTPTITGLNGYFDTTITFAVVMDELLWYYLQTREVVVQLHRVRDDDEVQRVIKHEKEEESEEKNSTKAVLKPLTTHEEQNVNVQSEMNTSNANQESNVEGRISQDSGDSKTSSNDLRIAEHMYETIAQGKMSLMSFATSALDSEKKLPLMRSHIKLYDAHHYHIASVEVQIRAQKVFSESFRYLIKTSEHAHVATPSSLPQDYHHKDNKNKSIEEFHNANREVCSNPMVSVETRAQELLKRWLSPSCTTQTSDRIDMMAEEEIIKDKAQKKQVEQVQHTMQSPTSKEKNAWWEKIQEINKKAVEEEKQVETEWEQEQRREQRTMTSLPVAPPTNLPSRHVSPTSQTVVVSPHVIKNQELIIINDEEERRGDMMSETESTGTATSSNDDFTIHVPPPISNNARQPMPALHKPTKVKDSLAPTSISSTININNSSTMPTMQKPSHVELPLNMEIYALIVDVNRVELPHMEAGHVFAHEAISSSSYPPRLSCQYSLIPINVLANADNTNSGASVSKINQQLIKLAAPNLPRYTIEYAQSYYHYQHGCGEYFPITSRRELMQIIQTPLTLFLIDEDMSKQQQEQEQHEFEGNEKKARENVHPGSLSAQKHDKQKDKLINSISHNSIDLKQESKMIVRNVWATAVCEWASAIKEPNKPFEIALPLYHNNTIIPNALVKVRLLALASSKSKNLLTKASTLELEQNEHEQKEYVPKQTTTAVDTHTMSATSLLSNNILSNSPIIENKDKQRESNQEQQHQWQEQEEKRRRAPFVLEEELLRLELDRLRHPTK